MQPLPLSRDKGFSILELIVALALGTAVLTGLGSLLASTQRFKARADRESSIQEFDMLLAAELAAMTRAYDSQPLHIPPVIHERGEIRLASGKANRIHRSQERLRPDPESRAISVLIPAFDARLRIKALPRSFNSIRGCAPGGREIPFAEFRTALAVTADGITHIRVLSAAEDGGGCRELRVRPTESAQFRPLDHEDLPFIRMIVPVRLEYTLYLGTGGELRYIGHAGDENIENQPIASRVSKFVPRLLETPDKFLLGVKLQATFEQKEISRAALSRFSKREYADLLLNEP